MKAIFCPRYGRPEVLQLREVERPAPKDNEVLVKVVAASVNRSDWEGLTGKPLYARAGGLLSPRHKVLGSDIAGRVEMVGRKAVRFKPGDEVFGDNSGNMGGFAEYACAPERVLALKPKGMAFEQAAAIPQAAVIALQGIRDEGRVQAGQKVLINGGGGATGTFAIQLAKSYGAEVTGVDNAGKQDLMLSIGADHCIDYAEEDFTESGEQYDMILDVVAHGSASAYGRALRRGGRYFAVGGSLATLLQILLLGPWIGRKEGKKIRVLAVRPNVKDVIQMSELSEAGKVVPVIDARYPLSEVPEALRSIGEGRVKGKAVIMVGIEDEAPVTNPGSTPSRRNT